MPIKSLIRDTISLQGFSIDSVDRFSFGIGIKSPQTVVLTLVVEDVANLEDIDRLSKVFQSS